jgi:hypothetical protein
MAAARRAHPAPAAAPAPTRLASLVVHLARMSAASDAEELGQSESRRRWRCAAPSRPSRPVPPDLAQPNVCIVVTLLMSIMCTILMSACTNVHTSVGIACAL